MKFKHTHADDLVTDKTLLPGPLSARYARDLQAHVGSRARIEVVSSETTMKRGWDFGNITRLEMTGREPLPITIVLNVAKGEVAGNVSIGSGLGQIIANTRSWTAEQTIRELMSEAGGYLSGLLPRESVEEGLRWLRPPELGEVRQHRLPVDDVLAILQAHTGQRVRLTYANGEQLIGVAGSIYDPNDRQDYVTIDNSIAMHRVSGVVRVEVMGPGGRYAPVRERR